MSASDKSDFTDSKVASATVISDGATHTVRSRPWWKLGGKDYSYVSIDGDFTATSESHTSSSESLDDSTVKKRNSVYQAPEAITLYKPPETYEGAHRFDPLLVWTADEEKKLVRRVSDHKLDHLHAWTPDISDSSTGRLLCQHVSCSLPYNWIVATSFKLLQITCSKIWA